MKELQNYGVKSLKMNEIIETTGGEAAPGSYSAGYTYGLMLRYAWNSFWDTVTSGPDAAYIPGYYTM